MEIEIDLEEMNKISEFVWRFRPNDSMTWLSVILEMMLEDLSTKGRTVIVLKK